MCVCEGFVLSSCVGGCGCDGEEAVQVVRFRCECAGVCVCNTLLIERTENKTQRARMKILNEAFHYCLHHSVSARTPESQHVSHCLYVDRWESVIVSAWICDRHGQPGVCCCLYGDT